MPIQEAQEVQEDCWATAEDEMEVYQHHVVRNTNVFMYQLGALGIGFGLLVVMCSESFGWTMFMMYAICCMVVVEQNFQDLGIDESICSYCRDFNIVMFVGLFVRFSWFKYLWVASIVWMLYKHWALISYEMKKRLGCLYANGFCLDF